MGRVDDAGGPTLETLASPAYGKPAPDLVAETEKLLLGSYLLAMDHAASPLDLADPGDYAAIPFDEAIKFIKARVPLTKAEWKALEEQVRFRAFTIAALSEPDAIERIRKRMIVAVEHGSPLAEFWTAAAAENAAGLGSSPWYWETVYRTNVQTAYNAGRAAEFTKSQPEYMTLVGIEDLRQTEICASLTNPPIVLPATHPFWQTHWPPFHFGCRTTVRAVFQSEIDALRSGDPAWSISGDERLAGTEPPASGFGGNPIDTGSFYKLTPSMVMRAEQYGILPDIKELAKAIGLKSYRIGATAKKIVSAVDAVAKLATSPTPDTLTPIRELLKANPTTEPELTEIGRLVIKASDAETEGDPGLRVFSTLRKLRAFGDSNLKHKYAYRSSVDGRKMLEQVQEYFPADWIQKSIEASEAKLPLQVHLGSNRAFYNPGKALLSLRSEMPTIAHELAHRLEQEYPRIKAMEKAFYDRRTAGEVPIKLSVLTGNPGYKDSEVAKKDKFVESYMGKDYQGFAYEILSMGIESLVGGKYNILENDIDYAAFIVGLLAGV